MRSSSENSDDSAIVFLADAQEIGAEVRRARREQGLKQEDLAFAAGVSRRLLQQVEAGKPTVRLDSLSKITQVLGLQLAFVPRRLRRLQPLPSVEDDE